MTFAKKVKFAVDMTDQIVNTTGVHIAGDFQTIAGFAGGDWVSNSTLLSQELNNPNIYSIVVDLPAFAKYEYKFINGDQFYETEFVPIESRVGYNFNDNRWLYVDSLSNDTTFVGAIRFSQNTPIGMNLIRFKVNLSNEIVASNGIHLEGNFQGWNTISTRMYSFQDQVYEYIAYQDTFITDCTYKFINGNTMNDEEIIPSACSVFGNRSVIYDKDTVLATVCFSACENCINTSNLSELKSISSSTIYPNPFETSALLVFNDSELEHQIQIYNSAGICVRTYSSIKTESVSIEKGNLDSGIYFISINSSAKNTHTQKLSIQ
ncbi:MAG: T9SS type A sorting domain-containing protein [Flavobacteriia bacterium]|nr:T9SS type A sorting domain-containing protein [Flavobacteriia bacterium]